MTSIFKTSLIVLLCFLVSNYMQAQQLWQECSRNNIEGVQSSIVPYIEDGYVTKLNYPVAFKKYAEAPYELSRSNGLIEALPMPDGSFVRFEFFESDIMEAGLKAKYPGIKNYRIFGLGEHKGYSGRVSMSYKGFTASIMTPNGRVYIDRFLDKEDTHYISYYTKNYTKQLSEIPSCGVQHDHSNDSHLEHFDLESSSIPGKASKAHSRSGTVDLKVYKVAIACTGEWGKKKGGTKELALSAINETVAKMNEIYELEASFRLVLIDNNDKLVFVDPATDPYTTPTEGTKLIGKNTTVIGSLIGLNGWDVGHVYTNGCIDVGGIAALSSVCSTFKGNAVTCHYSSNLDYIAVSVSCHEFGHQFSATHSFNHCDGKNETASTGFEPGSGHTIMSYGGLCPAGLNVTDGSYPYYHSTNLEQIKKFTRLGGGSTCGTLMKTDNVAPVISLPYSDGFHIPYKTPFKLTGSATDENNDELTYSWEEFDLGPLSTPGNPIGDAPQFVSEIPDKDPERVLPALDKVINKQFDIKEVLPFFTKQMTWRLTVRDNNPMGGGTTWEEVEFTATDKAGPFLVTYPNLAGEVLQSGVPYEITWDVANTDQAPVNCAVVNIYLSVDGGYTNKYLLKSYTANDGKETVVLPNLTTNSARITIEAADNIFFDLSDTNFRIEPGTPAANFHAVITPGFQDLCLPATSSMQIFTYQFNDSEKPITIELIDGLPELAEIIYDKNPVLPGDTVFFQLNAEKTQVSDEYKLKFRLHDGTDTSYVDTNLKLTSNDYSDLKILTPGKGASGIEAVPTLTWEADSDADSYIVELSDDPSFESGKINIVEKNIETNSYTLEIPLEKNSVYFWRVTGVNKCGNGATTAVSTFASEALSCKQYAENEIPISLPSSTKKITTLETVVVSNGEVSDINIINLSGSHSYFKELSATLESPSGTIVSLFNKRCAGATTFNAGFDDDSPNKIACPMLNGAVYKPEGTLSDFNGEALKGVWKLNIQDHKAGNGGKVKNYILEVCSNASLSGPVLTRNIDLKISPNEQDLINQGRLLTEDDDSDDDELIYTLVEIPTKGDLLKLGVPMKVGSKFSQADLNNNQISYLHTSGNTEPESDRFLFIVQDESGGWIDITSFEISIDKTNSVKPTEFGYDVSVYPNPTSNILNMHIPNLNSSYKVQVVNILGQTMYQSEVSKSAHHQINMAEWQAGNYFIQVQIDRKSKIFKVQKM